jgi:hypothetical protein
MGQRLVVRAVPALALKVAAGIVFAFCAPFVAAPASAGSMGKLLGALLARGVVRGAIVAGQSASPRYLPKTYGPDVLTVDQLATCIRKAAKLDGDDQQLEIMRAALLASTPEIDRLSVTIEFQRAHVDQYSQKSVDAFNALINRYNALVVNGKAKQANFNALVAAQNVEVDAYNAACATRYYADDLPEAQKLAGLP